jgi:hypothetical protein
MAVMGLISAVPIFSRAAVEGREGREETHLLHKEVIAVLDLLALYLVQRRPMLAVAPEVRIRQILLHR